MPNSYEDFAHSFAAHAEDSADNAHYDRPAVLQLLGDVAGHRVLDLGCGSGIYAEELLRRGADVVGFDASETMVQLAQERASGADLRVHDGHQPLTWLADDSIDDAVMALVLHHLEDPVPALREVRRVLKPNGRFVISTVHPMADWLHLGGSYFTDEMVEEVWNDGWEVRYRRVPLTTWCAEFRQAGFLIDQLVEPLPAETMQQRFSDIHAKRSHKPLFIAFVLVPDQSR